MRIENWAYWDEREGGGKRGVRNEREGMEESRGSIMGLERDWGMGVMFDVGILIESFSLFFFLFFVLLFTGLRFPTL